MGSVHQTSDLAIDSAAWTAGLPLIGSAESRRPGSAAVLKEGELQSGGKLIPCDMQHDVGMGEVGFD